MLRSGCVRRLYDGRLRCKSSDHRVVRCCTRSFSSVSKKQSSNNNRNCNNTSNVMGGVNLHNDMDIEYMHFEEKQQPWSNLLTYPAKARWRSGELPPDEIRNEIANILEETHRTSRQIRRTQSELVKKQRALAVMRETFRRNKGNVGSKVRKDLQNKMVTYGPEQTLAYMANRFIQNYSISHRVLTEVSSLLKHSFKPRKVLDVGLGCGSSSCAAISAFHQNEYIKDSKIDWILGVEPSVSQQQAAERLILSMKSLKEENKFSFPRLTLSNSLANASGNFDLALLCFTAQEFPHTSSILAAAAISWEKLADGGLLVMIEPGTPDGFHSIRAVREMILDACDPNASSEDTCHVVAPCTHNGRCPIDKYNIVKAEEETAKPKGQIISNKEELEPEKNLMNESDIFGNDDDDFDEDWSTEVDIDDDDGDDEVEDNDGDWDADLLNDEELDENMSDAEYAKFEREFQILMDDMSNVGRIVDKDSNMLQLPKVKGNKKGTNQKTVLSPSENTHAFEQGYCSFVHTMSTGKKKGEKISFVVLQKNRGPVKNLNEQVGLADVDLVSDLYQSLSNFKEPSRKENIERAISLEDRFLESNFDPLGLELVHEGKLSSWGRLIRAPIKKKGHILLDFCGENSKEGVKAGGRIVRHTVSRRKSETNAPGMYKSARKARWGGLWPDLSKVPK